ncbi:cation:proton antiporter [Candidatus Endoriftia persephone]|jgi:Kef-type K+ transport system membrane component KefB|uniref:Sodium/hydrogen exchanger n=3 Tax=Gammaproteobacteria TaxID=1236 RepID=G2FDW0_9GAMM|nr:cation:proton antiporter [Candidatus Endoriftia persephone]EGV51211.1 sodium/hydrogen exchanger [endosymbiont of Riftia pachyptila (vent Ph05)]EGW54944.1 sodium/hydrogen exchanger [endosymbiont of Tevnia jerichonana (vent Tica)]USF87901.1 cation:proton antiporter [Candidatus Endoriftia persephone]
MQDDPILFTIFLVFSGAALLATVALFARQALLIAYILLGALFGPWGFGFVDDPAVVKEIADIGIIFLLFLLGLDLKPQELLNLLRKTTLVTLGSSLLFFVIGFSVAWLFGFSWVESLVVGGTMTFSSTIIGLKLLPTTVLHHQRTGEIIISILLLQDLLAIVMLLLLEGRGVDLASAGGRFILLLLALPVLILGSWLVARFLLVPLIRRFSQIKEYVFLLAIGWCLGMAELAGGVGLSREIGAFSAGVALATSPIALYIAESLRPLRDFFLILFFFSLGAGVNLEKLPDLLLPALLLATILMLVKPWAFRRLLERTGEDRERSGEIGWRLGQLSEFSLLIAVLALDLGQIGDRASYLIQLTTLFTFLVSTYLVVMRFYTPIAISDRLRRD